jgi:hypothetical protein
MSTVDEFGKLDALRQSGVLSQEEFDGNQAKLLRGIVVLPVSHIPQPNGAEAPQGEGCWQAYAPKFHPDYWSPSAPSSSPFAARTRGCPVLSPYGSGQWKSAKRGNQPWKQNG